MHTTRRLTSIRRFRGSPHVLVEVRVQSLALDRATNTPVVILEEIGGDRVLPIWIGPGEASAIAMQLGEMEFARPLTHDLICSVLKSLGGALQRVIITRVEKSTYFAELIVQRNGDLISLDARPSDSIAVALRVDARMFAEDDLLEEAPIEVEEGETAPDAEGPQLEPLRPEASLDAAELKEHLKGLDPEDFGRFSP